MSKKASSKGSGEDHELMLERKARFYKNYVKACKPLNVTPSKTLKDLIHKSEEEGGSGDLALAELVFIDDDLGPSGTRALCAALCGRGLSTTKATPYSDIRTLVLRNCGGLAIGAWSVAEMLRVGGCEIEGAPEMSVPLEKLEMSQSGIGLDGCMYLGAALSAGCNAFLTNLVLDQDATIGDEGCALLVDGIASNEVLRVLSLAVCGVGVDGATALTKILRHPYSRLDTLNLNGNPLGCDGLAVLAGALTWRHEDFAVARHTEGHPGVLGNHSLRVYVRRSVVWSVVVRVWGGARLLGLGEGVSIF